jgi:cytoskeleton protein RodZ
LPFNCAAGTVDRRNSLHINVEHSMSDPGFNEHRDESDEQPAAEQPQSSPGARLAAYRQERGWTVEQVAGQLNLAPRQIAALERDDYPALPGMVIVRGFIRTYAKLLKVDAAPLLAMLEAETAPVHDPIAPQKTLEAPFSDARLPSMTERSGLSSKWVVGALLAALLGAGIWSMRKGGDLEEASKAVAPQVKEQPTVSSDAPANPQPPARPNSAEPTEAVPPVAAQPPVEAAPAAQAPQAQAPAGKNTLQLKAREGSWIEIKRASNNAIVLSRIVKAGESESVEVSEPMSAVIGNANGVEATLRGEPLKLKTNSNSNVAHITLK